MGGLLGKPEPIEYWRNWLTTIIVFSIIFVAGYFLKKHTFSAEWNSASPEETSAVDATADTGTPEVAVDTDDTSSTIGLLQ